MPTRTVRTVVAILLAAGPSSALLELSGGALGTGSAAGMAGMAAGAAPAADSPATPTSGAGRRPAGRWDWPLRPEPAVARGFEPPAQRWGRGHRGVDLAGAPGQPVLAADDGVVSYSGVINGVGISTVSHPGGLRSTYQPVDQRAPRGAAVRRGDRIGVLAGAGSHCAADACLHLGAVSGDGVYHDPLALLGRARLVLLPPH